MNRILPVDIAASSSGPVPGRGLFNGILISLVLWAAIAGIIALIFG